MGKVMFSVCPHLGGGGSGQSPAGGGSGQSPAGGGGQVSPAGGVRSVQPGGVQTSWGGSVQPGGGGVSPAGGELSQWGGVSASCTLLRAVCLLRSRRHEDFLVYIFSEEISTVILLTMIGIFPILHLIFILYMYILQLMQPNSATWTKSWDIFPQHPVDRILDPLVIPVFESTHSMVHWTKNDSNPELLFLMVNQTYRSFSNVSLTQ